MTARAMLVSSRLRVTFNLDGHATIAEDLSSPYDTTSAIKIDADGKMYSGESIDGAGISYSQIDTTTDWLRPIHTPTIYYARYSSVTGTFTSTPGSVNTAIAITVDLIWTIQRGSVGSTAVTFTLEILDTDQTTVLASGAYSITATNGA